MHYFKMLMVSVCLIGSNVLAGGNGPDDDIGYRGAEWGDALLRHFMERTAWEDQIIYMIMTDRFNDADPSNNDQGAGEYDPARDSKYSGGDLKGIEQKLDYIRDLGITAVWITPPVHNQWWDPLNTYSGYHGYWARNLLRVDEHYGTLQDYKSLARALHRRDMYLIQDVVVNHMANCFYWDDPQASYDPADPRKNVKLNLGAQPPCGPTQKPFDQWNPLDPAHYAAGIFHWTPRIWRADDPHQEKNYQLLELDDLNTENPVVVNALKDSYAYWIKSVGVDAFRIDTAFFVPPAFFTEFMYSTDKKHPGMVAAARREGRRFFAFGEGSATDEPYADVNARKIETYATDPNSGKPILHGMLNFPLYGTLTDVFAKGRPTGELGYRLRNMMSVHKRPHWMPTFVDNHDRDRFLATANESSLRQALLLLMTTPGIPVIYYGTEQGFTASRGAMFAAGFQSGGVDHFNKSAPLYRYLARIIELRKNNPALRRGIPSVVKENPYADGAFAYRMDHQGKSLLMVFNTADTPVLMDNAMTGLAKGRVLQTIETLEGPSQKVVIGPNGKLTMPLAARAGKVFKVTDRYEPVPGTGVSLTLDPISADVKTADFGVSGTAVGVKEIQLVVDSRLDDAQTVTVKPNGTWSATVSIAGMVDPDAMHTVIAYAADSAQVSNLQTFKVQPSWTLLKTYADAKGDDSGPRAAYQYPTDASWGSNRQGDILAVDLYGSGPVLRIGVTINKITKIWSPPNGFDHVAFSIYIDVPGKTGLSVMPLQNASVPAGMNWDLKLRAHGWSNALFNTLGATASSEGASISPASLIETKEETQTIFFTVPRRALGTNTNLSGVKVYVTTWDYDNGYRALVPGGGQWVFGGGDGTVDPLIMDDTAVIAIP